MSNKLSTTLGCLSQKTFEYGNDETVSVQCQYEHEYDEGSGKARNHKFLGSRVLDNAQK